MFSTSVQQWERLTDEAKRAFAKGEDMVAKRYFQLAEQEAIQISPTDVRRGASLSWLSLLYFKAANYQLAEEMFAEAEHIYTASAPSQFKTEILTNFVKLGMYASSKGRSIRAQDYCDFQAEGSAPASFFRTSNMRLCQAKNWSLAQRKTLAKKLSEQRNSEISNLRQRSASDAESSPVWSRFMDKLQRIATQQPAPEETDQSESD